MTSTYLPPSRPILRVGADGPAAAPDFERLEWSTDCMEEARARLEAVYDGRQFRAKAGPETFAFRFASSGDSRLSLQTGSFLGHIQGVIPWSRDYVLTWFRSGSVTVDHPLGQFTSVGARPFLLPTETSYSFSMTPHRHGIVLIDAAFLERVAAERHGRHPQRIVFDLAAVPTDDEVARWRAALGEATPVIVRPSARPEEREAAQAALVRAVLDLFPWRAVDVPDVVRTERTRRLRLAVEFVHEHADQQLTAADIAGAADMSVRTLQQVMSDNLGSSPTTYLRDVRLDRVRQDLLSATPATARVSEVARQWGFGNLGRFSSAYVARFGEYPRTTLAG
ncbi:helix-turn-helix domain-containing protein [Frondihabitans peucedani]|uniref:HTH araC/xylS-type domain-containing protein n=1 Tax=Frondihabitans peucedani TaxID=598626 RepID=A0ABP8E5B1_9MICO